MRHSRAPRTVNGFPFHCASVPVKRGRLPDREAGFLNFRSLISAKKPADRGGRRAEEEAARRDASATFQIAARMAFKEVYTRAVSEARGNRSLPTWSVSLGYDPGMRADCVREAQRKNLISQVYAAKLLAYDPPTDEAVKLIGEVKYDKGRLRIGTV